LSRWGFLVAYKIEALEMSNATVDVEINDVGGRARLEYRGGL
jgi:hypothetical protein